MTTATPRKRAARKVIEPKPCICQPDNCVGVPGDDDPETGCALCLSLDPKAACPAAVGEREEDRTEATDDMYAERVADAEYAAEVDAEALPPNELLADLSHLQTPDVVMFGSHPALVQEELMDLIATAVLNDPRQLQAEIGISEYGSPCTRKVVYMLAEFPPSAPEGVAWRAAMGKAGHAYVAEILAEANARLGRVRWLIENRVLGGEIDNVPLPGSADVFDLVTGDVIDWKFVGPTSHKRVRAAVNTGRVPSVGYRVQGHTYGRGFARRGLKVNNIHICFFPIAGEFSDAIWWTEPYDEQIVLDALARATELRSMSRALGAGTVAALAETEEDYCTHCSWFAPGLDDPANGKCPGADAIVAKREANMAATHVPPKPF
jgi:hypothetical protein